ncbi:hypothetical protein NUM_47430 [Actinocatenispora comari]|uniref:Uncharacterized protein n=1 Tax=Actinocatenispora comari TaxID=2807577 RepID=A0A8J4ADS1_9ACTN|nr:hypothetical protein NUM_47430 [Actinocatenispora comari]
MRLFRITERTAHPPPVGSAGTRPVPNGVKAPAGYRKTCPCLSLAFVCTSAFPALSAGGPTVLGVRTTRLMLTVRSGAITRFRRFCVYCALRGSLAAWPTPTATGIPC